MDIGLILLVLWANFWPLAVGLGAGLAIIGACIAWDRLAP